MPVYNVKPTVPLINRRLAKLYGVVAAFPFSERGGTVLRDVVGGFFATTTSGALSWSTCPHGPAVRGTAFQASTATTGISGNAVAMLQATIAIDDQSNFACPISIGDASTSLAAFAIFVNVRGAGVVSVEYAGGNFATSAAPALVPGVFYHILVVKRPGAINTTTSIYINGVDYGLSGGASTGTPNVANSVITLGSFTGSATTYLSYRCTHALLGNRSLAATQIAALTSPDPWALYRQDRRNLFLLAQPVPVSASPNGNFIDVRLGGI